MNVIGATSNTHKQERHHVNARAAHLQQLPLYTTNARHLTR